MSTNYRNHGSGYAAVSIQELGGGNNASAAPDMEESLVGNVSRVPVATSIPMMQVVAPATLPEGYEFDVSLGDSGQTMKVSVPTGGIEQGQTFSVPFPEKLQTPVTGIHIPVGHWRDPVFNVFAHGICHPHLWTSWLCTFLATGQVIHRMQFSWTGHATDNPAQRSSGFSIIFGLVCLYFTVHFMLIIIMFTLDPNWGHDLEDPDYEKIDEPPAFFIAVGFYRLWWFIYLVGSTVILIHTRKSVRERYGIPAEDLEDCLCSVACHCCVAAQLLRHTTDYDVYPSHCCSETGLPPHVPTIV